MRPSFKPLSFSLVALLALLPACAAGNATESTSAGSGGESGGGGGSGGGSGGSGGSGGGSGGSGGDLNLDGGVTPVPGEIFLNSLDKLYKFEPTSKTVTEIGTFDCVINDPSGTSDGGMQDIALDKDSALYGVAKLGPQTPGGVTHEHVIVSIDKATGHCEKVFAVPNDLVNAQGLTEVRGLSFVPIGTLSPDKETLVGLTIYGSYISIDLAAKTAKLVGNLNGNGPANWSTKGADIVSLILDKTYVTARLQSPNDYLTVMDPKTGAITQNLGETSQTTFGGIAYWAGTLYGFTVAGGVYAIDPANGQTTPVTVAAPPGSQYHGAGVTTSAPIEPPK